MVECPSGFECLAFRRNSNWGDAEDKEQWSSIMKRLDKLLEYPAFDDDDLSELDMEGLEETWTEETKARVLDEILLKLENRGTGLLEILDNAGVNRERKYVYIDTENVAKAIINALK